MREHKNSKVNKKNVHFLEHKLQVGSAEPALSSSREDVSPANPQSLQVQLGQGQSPGGSICNDDKCYADVNTIECE